MTNEPTQTAISINDLIGDSVTDTVKETALEKALATVSPEDASAAEASETSFKFRQLLTEAQRSNLEISAPKVAQSFIEDYNAIIQFGEPVLTKLNSSSTHLLNQQKDIQIPEADAIVNDLLREIDGYSKKYRNPKVEEGLTKFINKIKGTAYSLKTLVRESKPIVDRINMAEIKLREAELSLADNITRGQQLHKNTTATLEEVVLVLAALEEIIEVIRDEFYEVDNLLKAQEANSESVNVIEYKGQPIAANKLQEIHAQIAQSLSEVESTWFSWRQQFFMGYAQAPAIRNLIMVSATLQRRLQVFRTMGIPSARSSLAMWQQAALAKESAELGSSVQKATNDLIQSSFEATGRAVSEVAMTSQAPVITDETVWAVVDSIKTQAQGIIAADRWGREMRARNIKALEQGEVSVREVSVESRREIVANAVSAAHNELDAAPAADDDLLGQLGVK